MSVTSQVDKTGPFLITGLPQVIPVGFPFQSSADLLVLDAGASGTGRDPAVTLTLGSDYTVTGGGYNSANQMQTGSITVVSTGTHTVITGDYITIMRAAALTQDTAFIPPGPNSITLLERMGDKLATLTQQVNEIAARALQFERVEIISALLRRDLRASKYLAFDASGGINFVGGSTSPLGDLSASSVIATGSTTARTLGARFAEIVDVKDFGATGDGVTDDSTAISNAYLYAVTQITANPYGTDNRGNVTIYFPPGTYYVTGNNVLMSSVVGMVTTWGLSYAGAGAAISRIKFRPAGASYNLFFDDNVWKHVSITGLEFDCNSSTACLLKLYSTGGADGYIWSDVIVSGTWKRGFWLYGTNTGSEFTWFKCYFGTTFTDAVLYIGSDANSQFVNYSFIDCGVSIDGGDFIYAYTAGSINCIGGSWSCLSSRVAQGYFFNFANGDGGNGASRLMCKGQRIEYKASGLMGLIKCLWKKGTVHFDSIHDDINYGVDQPANLLTCDFSTTNSAGPSVLFTNCILSGQHKYTRAGSNDYVLPCNNRYESCCIREYDAPDGFLITPNPGSNIGGIATVVFDTCAGSNTIVANATGSRYVWDTVYNWQKSSTNRPRPRSAVVIDFDGCSFPTQTQTHNIQLPLNSLIKKVTFYKAAGGASVSTTFVYTLKTNEGAPTTLATFNGAVAWNLGFNGSTDNINFMADSLTKRTLILSAANILERSGLGAGFCVIEYVA